MFTRTLTVSVLTSLLWVGAARADDLQSEVLAIARATPTNAYSFRQTMVIERTGSARQVLVERFDPRRPAANRWSLVSVDGRAPTAKEAERAQKARRGPTPSYADLAKWFGAPATRTNTETGYVTYRFARLPKNTLKLGSHDASADVMAEALVNTKGKVPFVERVRLTSTKRFRMMMVASVQQMAFTRRYRLLSGGHVVPAESASDISGSLLGKSGHIQSAVSFAEFEAVR